MASRSFAFTILVSTSVVFEGIAQQDHFSCSSDDMQSSHDAQSLLVIRRHVERGESVQEEDSGHGIAHQAQQSSLAISQHLVRIGKAMPEGTVTKSLLESFRICGQCSNFQRFGEANDGGYLMCMDGLQDGFAHSAYSLGVEHHDQWSQDVVDKLNITVNQFDCTVQGSDCKRCNFFKKCIVSADGANPVPEHETEGWSLEQALSETSQANAMDASLLMKMDIESSEWPIYASESPEVLRKFGELIVEFHNLQDEARHPLYLQAMQHILAAGFKVAHLHGNNYGNMYQVAKEGNEQLWEVVTPSGFHRVRAAMSLTSEEIGRKFVGEVFHGVDTGKGWLKLRDGGYSLIAGDGLIFLKLKMQENTASIPEVVEVTFVHGDARPDGCSAEQLYDQNLDAPNNYWNSELPMAHLE
jgi:hypothetical protein